MTIERITARVEKMEDKLNETSLALKEHLAVCGVNGERTAEKLQENKKAIEGLGKEHKKSLEAFGNQMDSKMDSCITEIKESVGPQPSPLADMKEPEVEPKPDSLWGVIGYAASKWGIGLGFLCIIALLIWINRPNQHNHDLDDAMKSIQETLKTMTAPK